MKLTLRILMMVVPVVILITFIFAAWSYNSIYSAVMSNTEKTLSTSIHTYIKQQIIPDYEISVKNSSENNRPSVSSFKLSAQKALEMVGTPWPTHKMIFTADGKQIYCSQNMSSEEYKKLWSDKASEFADNNMSEQSGDISIGESEWFYKTVKFEPWDWYVIMAVKHSSIYSNTNSFIGSSLFILLSLAVSITFIIITFFKYNIINPIQKISTNVEAFTYGLKPFKTGVPDGNIIGRLARQIEDMSQTAFNQRKAISELNTQLEVKYSATHKELIKSEMQYRRLFENMLNGCAYHKIIMYEDTPVDYVFLEVNSAFEKQTGLKAKDIVGKRITEVLPDIIKDKVDWIGIYGKVAITGENIQFDSYSEPLGEYFSISAYQIKKYYFAVTVQNITEQVEANNTLKKINKNLDKAVKDETNKRVISEQFMLENKKFIEMGQLISSIAHQWRQPINALGLYIQTLKYAQRNNTLDKETLENTVDNSMKLIMNLSDIIDDFMNYYSPKSAEKPVPVIKVVLDTFRLIGSNMALKNISYQAVCKCAQHECGIEDMGHQGCAAADKLITGFEGEFKQVVLNLLSNAVDAIEERQETEKDFSPKIHVYIKVNDDNILIEILDNGIGIEPENIRRLFDPYFTTKDEGKGTGIGLYMSKNIIEKHMNGKLSIRLEGENKIFSISLKASD